MKAWKARIDYDSFAMIVFAETAGKAKSISFNTFIDYLNDIDFRDIRVLREKNVDKYYKDGMNVLDWDNAEDRIIMVKECGFVCGSEYKDDCTVCPAKQYCDYYIDELNRVITDDSVCNPETRKKYLEVSKNTIKKKISEYIDGFNPLPDDTEYSKEINK